MKIKSHIIAKIVFIVVLSFTFALIGVMLKQIPESDVIRHHEKSLSMSTTTLSDRVDKWYELKSDELYYVVKPMSNTTITIYSILISSIMVLILDLVAGVGRSRTEERMKRITSQG